MVRTFLLTLILLAGLGLPAQARQAFTPPPDWVPAPAHTPGKVINAAITERPTEALIFWRTVQKQRPVLVLYSNDPFLQPIPANYQKVILPLIRTGTDNDLMRAANSLRPDPFVLPPMAVTAALEAGIFTEVIWVAAQTQDLTRQSVESFREHLLQYGAVTKKESLSVQKTAGGFAWARKGVKISAIHQGALPALARPSIVHIDLSYFAASYLDEIRTPIFPLLKDFFEPIQRQESKVIAASISLSSIDGRLPLESRIIASLLADILTHPDYIGKPLPDNWERYRKIRYLDVFFQTDNILALYLEMEKAHPYSADIQYGLYSTYRTMKRPEDALRHLAKAVATDPVYALEYDALAKEARQRGEKLLAFDMQELAVKAQPHNIFFRLHMVETLKMFDKKEKALDLIGGLQIIPWSNTYYPKVLALLDRWKQEIVGGKR